ncbi:MAG: lipoprotein [Candidatus Magnetoglobus multicellularis str. Araruama]|uniref:Lipoprotein n=1 Tax=Candidatus Magnetoglobus multicellularis str. Araruama TaxID=890399 RepID=A0A1V1PF00_9BACT|nr:MAG: lipoprotein [Candidatus Magnetoglobus multicellularis str. Araruama]
MLGMLLLISFITMGCAPSALYQWGDYENFLYKRYLKPGSVTAQEEILTLENHLAQTYAQEKLPPPGYHAHLAYLYITEGQYDRAYEHFNVEKNYFLSPVILLMDLLIG